MARLMILGAGEMQTPIIKKAKDLGHYVISIDRDANAIGNKFADCPLEIDTNDLDGIIDAARKLKIDGILTTSDYPIRVVAEVCDKFNLKGPNKNAAKISTNKFLMREHLAKHNFNVPKYKIISNEDDINNILFFPAVIKPLDSSGSRGVKKVYTIDEFLAAYTNTKNNSRTNDVLIEEYIEGPEYSVETLSQNGVTHIIAITEKTTQGKDGVYFVENRHFIPADLTDIQINQISETVIKLIDSLNLGDSASHTELKLSDKGIFIIEIGARLGGDFITSDLVPLATGIDMLENVINLALGHPIVVVPKKLKFSGIQFVTSENYELVNNFIDKNAAQLIRYNLVDFTEKELESSFDRLGYFIAVSDTREELLNLLNLNTKEE